MKFPEQYRWQSRQATEYHTKPGDPFGAFLIPGEGRRRPLKVIADDGEVFGWEHVSVSVVGWNGCPSWDEMCAVKAMFWEDSETVVQFHVAKADYVNIHPGCLHLFRKADGEFPMPPKACV